MQQKNDMLCVEDIVFMLLEKLKSNGTFDEIRRHCVTDIDAKPTYQNWKQRIESNVNKFLSKVKYTPELNKNTVREQLRKHFLDGHETQDIEEGADRILIQVLAPRTLSIFEPKIAVAVDEYLGIKNKASPIEFNSLKETSQNSIINNVSNVENSAVFNPKIGADNIPCDKTQKDDRKDLRSYKKEKSSSLCKEPKSLNGNRTDDENDTRGSLKQKSTQHKNKTSASDKFKSSSTNHKSNKKDNNCKELVDKFKKVVNKSKDVSKPKNIVNKSMDIINKSKDVNNKSKDTVNKAKDVIDNSKDVSKPKDIVDKSKDIINKSKDVIDNSKDISKPKDIVDKSKDIIIKSKDVNDKSKDMVDRSKDKSFLSMNSSSNSSNHVSNRTDTKRTKRSLKEKKKLSSFCKESKLLKNNQSDDESNAGGSSKQKNTIHKNKSSSSNKSKSSSSNHKNNKKDNTSTNVVDKSNNLSLLKSSTCTDVDKSKNKSLLKNTTCSSHKSNCNDSKRLKLSQPEKNELPFNNKNMEENKSEKLEWNDFKSSDIKNDEQDAANVLLSMSTISYESCHSEIITENSYSISKTLKTPKIKNVDKKKILPSSDNDNIKGNSRLKSNTLKSSQLQNTVKSVPNIVGHLFEKVCSVDIESNEVSLPVIDNVSINMCEKLEQKSKNDMDIKINDSANTVSKQILHEKIENNSVKVLDDDKLHYSFKGFSEEETILCENHKLLKNMIKTLQAKINNHDVINDGFKGFTSAEMYPCKHRDIVNAELIKFKYSKSSSDFIGFSEEDAQLSIGHKYVIQQLELAKKQNVDNHQENVKCDGNGIQNDKTFNEVMTAYLYKSNNDDVTTSKNITKKHCPTVNNNHNHDNWVVEQEMKYKLLPVQVKLERLMDYRCNNAKRVSDSSQVSL